MATSNLVKYATVSVLMAAFSGVHAYQAITFDLSQEIESQQKNGFAPKICTDKFTITPANIGNEVIQPEDLKAKFANCLKEESMAAAEKMLPSHKSAAAMGSVFTLMAGLCAFQLFRQRRREQQGPAPK